MPIDAAELRKRASEITWFHTMQLSEDVRTAGVYDPARTLSRLKLPARMDGTRVLDVGAWDGFYSSRWSGVAPRYSQPTTTAGVERARARATASTSPGRLSLRR